MASLGPLTVAVDVLLDHLDGEDEAELGHRLQVVDVDDVRPQHVVEVAAQLSQVIAAGAKKDVCHYSIKLTDSNKDCNNDRIIDHLKLRPHQSITTCGPSFSYVKLILG